MRAWEAVTLELISHKIRPSLGGDTLTHKSHKNCAEFLYPNFNLSIHEVGLPIYRFRSLGKEENRVEWERKKWCGFRV